MCGSEAESALAPNVVLQEEKQCLSALPLLPALHATGSRSCCREPYMSSGVTNIRPAPIGLRFFLSYPSFTLSLTHFLTPQLSTTTTQSQWRSWSLAAQTTCQAVGCHSPIPPLISPSPQVPQPHNCCLPKPEAGGTSEQPSKEWRQQHPDMV